MGLKITITGGSGPDRKTAVLLDSPDPLPRHNLRVNGQRILQVANFARAEFVWVFDRGNRRTTLSWETTRQHADELEASVFALDHDAAVPAVGDVMIEISDGASTVTRYMADAGVEQVAMIEQIGATTRWGYGVTGGGILRKLPA